MFITIIGSPRTICHKVLFNFRVSFDGLLSRKEILLESSNRINIHIGEIVDIPEVQSNVSFELCIDEKFIEFWGDKIIFESPHATISPIMSPFQQ